MDKEELENLTSSGAQITKITFLDLDSNHLFLTTLQIKLTTIPDHI